MYGGASFSWQNLCNKSVLTNCPWKCSNQNKSDWQSILALAEHISYGLFEYAAVIVYVSCMLQ